MPAIFQKNHPERGPAILPIAIRQSAGGFCRPRSQREITIDEQFSPLPKSSWFKPKLLRRDLIRRAHEGSGEATNCRGRAIPPRSLTNRSIGENTPLPGALFRHNALSDLSSPTTGREFMPADKPGRNCPLKVVGGLTPTVNRLRGSLPSL